MSVVPYRLDWLGSIFLLSSLWLVTKKNYRGWYFSLAGNLLWTGLDFYLKLWGAMPLTLVALVMAYYALRKWKKEATLPAA